MVEVTDVFMVLEWVLLCGIIAIVGFAALVEFTSPRAKSAIGKRID